MVLGSTRVHLRLEREGRRCRRRGRRSTPPSFSHTGPPLRAACRAPPAHVALARVVGALREVVHRRRRGRSSPPRGAHRLQHALGQRHAVGHHPVDGGRKPEGVPGLEGPELPVVAPAHGVIDGRHVVADLAHAPRRVRQPPREHLPREAPRGALVRHQHPHALAEVFDVAQGLHGLGHLGGGASSRGTRPSPGRASARPRGSSCRSRPWSCRRAACFSTIVRM
jgi:hypothetical protein